VAEKHAGICRHSEDEKFFDPRPLLVTRVRSFERLAGGTRKEDNTVLQAFFTP
jgi:hypothetical protein